MDRKKRRTSIKIRAYLYVGISVFLSAMVVALVSYYINVKRIDSYFKGLCLDMAKNFASQVDPDYLLDLKEAVESEEYQELREIAEETKNEKIIEEYLRKNGLLYGYRQVREQLTRYQRNMEDVEYIYIVVWGAEYDMYDMYLVDDDRFPIYETGYYEKRERAFYGTDASKVVKPTINHGDWGWNCSAFVPVYTDYGTLVCQVGCDVSMNDIMKERVKNFIIIIVAALFIMAISLVGVILLIRQSVIKPLNLISSEMKKFKPSESHDYEEAGVLNLDLKNNDEIGDIHDEIRSMQIKILDYVRDITTIQKEKEKVESDVLEKAKEISQISMEAYSDALTNVGSTVAYIKKTKEMEQDFGKQDTEFAVVMIDVNFLKSINDQYGHSAGDEYLKGCCRILCQTYKHSPVFRTGGDEFVAILMGADYQERDEKLSEIRETFDSCYNQEKAEPWMKYSASVGMAEYREGDATVDVVLKRADKAMYEEKARLKKVYGHTSDLR